MWDSKPPFAGVQDGITQPWDDIAKSYARSPSLAPLCNLAAAVSRSPLRHAIYGARTMDGLIISQTPTYVFHGSQVLLVQVGRDETVEFRFQDYQKACSPGEAFETLRFLLVERLGWIAKPE